MKAVNEIRKNGGHQNIVSVFEHGWLGDGRYYYFDMELCVLNLDSFLRGNIGEVSLGLPQYLDPGYASQDLGCLNMWSIMTHITRGLVFMHFHKQLHRDLKPRNGTALLH